MYSLSSSSAHTTNFDKLVELVVSCGGETLQIFLDRAGGNATYTSKMSAVEFVNVIGTCGRVSTQAAS